MKAFREMLTRWQTPVNCFVSQSGKIESITAHPHWHDAIEVLYVAEGSAKQQIDDSFFTISQNDIVIIWSNQIHSTYSFENKFCKIFVFQFLFEDHMIAQNLSFYGAVNQKSNQWEKINDILTKIHSENESKTVGYEFLIKSYLYKFYALILRNMESLPVKTVKESPNKNIIIEIFNYIDNNYMSSINLKTAAAEVSLSVSHFMRVFKLATGMTFKRYLDIYRINRSTILLQQGFSVTKAAMECGFENINTFIRLFKQHKKCLPSVYKNNYYKQ